jgi:2'-hydroxyisoflavone reductase
MKFLVMGGTLFLGRAIVEVGLNAGHQITVFNRGQTNPDLFPEIEHLIGDRNSDLRALSGRSFDALIDTSAYFPRQVASVVDALAGQIEHYSFVSSMSVYAQSDEPNADESAGLGTVTDPKDEHSDENYGGFKALCEHALDSALPGRAHHVRAGLIVGPHDNTGRFSYWVQRFVSGGDVLAPQPPDQPIQLIDVRDLAEWTVHAATTGVTGPINASGAPGTHTMASMLATIQTSTASQATVHWVDERPAAMAAAKVATNPRRVHGPGHLESGSPRTDNSTTCRHDLSNHRCRHRRRRGPVVRTRERTFAGMVCSTRLTAKQAVMPALTRSEIRQDLPGRRPGCRGLAEC